MELLMFARTRIGRAFNEAMLKPLIVWVWSFGKDIVSNEGSSHPCNYLVVVAWAALN